MADWSPGDLALCVRSGEFYCECGVLHGGNMHLRKGRKFEVKAVTIASRHEQFRAEDCECQVLRFSITNGHVGRFVKITPGHQIEGSEVDQRNPWKVGQDA